MKKSLKFVTVIALTMSGFVMTQPNILAMSSQPEILPNVWVSRSLQEVQHSVQQAQQTGVYTIQWGDTLSTISQATGVSIQELSKLNHITDIDLIIAGSTLYMDYVNHTITYVTPAEEPVTVSTTTGEVVEAPAEAVSQLIQAEAAAEQASSETQAAQEVVTAPTAEDATTQTRSNDTAVTETAEQASTEEAIVAPESVPNTVEAVEPESSLMEGTEAIEVANEEMPETPEPETQGTPMVVEATAYSYQEAGLSNFTADGTDLTQDSKVIAVDPSVIPLGTMVYIPGYGTYRAADTGGAIVGNKIDIHFNSIEECYQFGRRQLTIYILK
ncbi:3D domain-containing protein [Aerococcaceae bacterium NML210727]|nr:3D domain-containing protein [Aerococcaceae bacterium NML210727]MCW6655317.1 3D domain-containing protein [Aerococcaceae bacterium NML201296]MCW6682929.1 3D domain-containing protein [Aerococcaceae bacterium NML160702]